MYARMTEFLYTTGYCRYGHQAQEAGTVVASYPSLPSAWTLSVQSGSTYRVITVA